MPEFVLPLHAELAMRHLPYVPLSKVREIARNEPHALASVEPAADLGNVGCADFGLMMRLAVRRAASVNAVTAVVGRRAVDDVRRVAARRVVARMARDGRPPAMRQEERDAVSVLQLARSNAKRSVAAVRTRPCNPRPTLIIAAPINLRPESFGNRPRPRPFWHNNLHSCVSRTNEYSQPEGAMPEAERLSTNENEQTLKAEKAYGRQPRSSAPHADPAMPYGNDPAVVINDADGPDEAADRRRPRSYDELIHEISDRGGG